MGVRNSATYFAGSRTLTFPAGADEDTTGAIGLFIETAGYVKVDNYDGSTDEFKVPDGTYLPGMFKKVYATPTRGAVAGGIHVLT